MVVETSGPVPLDWSAVVDAFIAVDPRVLAHIPPDRFSMTTTHLYPALVERHEAVYGYRYTGYWIDIGAPERYLQAHRDKNCLRGLATC